MPVPPHTHLQLLRESHQRGDSGLFCGSFCSKQGELLHPPGLGAHTPLYAQCAQTVAPLLLLCPLQVFGGNIIFLALPCTVSHAITPHSPLHGMSLAVSCPLSPWASPPAHLPCSSLATQPLITTWSTSPMGSHGITQAESLGAHVRQQCAVGAAGCWPVLRGAQCMVTAGTLLGPRWNSVPGAGLDTHLRPSVDCFVGCAWRVGSMRVCLACGVSWCGAQMMERADMELIVLVEGVDASTSAKLQGLHSPHLGPSPPSPSLHLTPALPLGSSLLCPIPGAKALASATACQCLPSRVCPAARHSYSAKDIKVNHRFM